MIQYKKQRFHFSYEICQMRFMLKTDEFLFITWSIYSDFALKCHSSNRIVKDLKVGHKSNFYWIHLHVYANNNFVS